MAEIEPHTATGLVAVLGRAMEDAIRLDERSVSDPSLGARNIALVDSLQRNVGRAVTLLEALVVSTLEPVGDSLPRTVNVRSLGPRLVRDSTAVPLTPGQNGA
jgi:hypothetical protein